MFRVLFLLLVLVALAFGLGWLIDRPGEITLNWQGYTIETSVLTGLGLLLALIAALAVAWNLLSLALRAPSVMSDGRGARRRERGYSALSRGIIAVGTGNSKLAISGRRRNRGSNARWARAESSSALWCRLAVCGARDGGP